MIRSAIIILGTFFLALAGPSLLWAKAHVPINLVQVCNKNGVVKNISGKRLQTALDRGGCRLPACDFKNIFQAGETCDNTDDDADGFCDVPGSPRDVPPVNSAVNVTPACTNPY